MTTGRYLIHFSSVRRHFILVGFVVILLSVVSGCANVQSPTTNSSNEVDTGEALVPDRLELPAIDADIPVVRLGWHKSGSTKDSILTEWDVAEYAAGWHKNSALPGESGNIVMSGHNNILGSVFRELDQLRAGDEAVVWFGGEQHRYEVDQVVIVPEKFANPEQRLENAKWIAEADEERLTLVSCWPRNNNTHRIIVVAHPADK